MPSYLWTLLWTFNLLQKNESQLDITLTLAIPAEDVNKIEIKAKELLGENNEYGILVEEEGIRILEMKKKCT